jgi:2-polyprenyl-3-methyl-5-hydroxy-6-metoxy-1,4-benzoquinol methylase
VPCSCCDYIGAAEQQFTAKKAAKQLEGYRRGKIEPTTRMLRDGVVEARLNRGSLLDVGAGIGALTFELLDRGVASAVAVEASQAYIDTASDEAANRGRSKAIDFRHGDFVGLAGEVADADLVALDRVVCCYADYQSLLDRATRRARQGLALSYPRDRWFVRLVLGFENALRKLRSNTFRTFVHPTADMERLITSAGFKRVQRRTTAIWAADVYVRWRESDSGGPA